jgi:hypothetical protein
VLRLPKPSLLERYTNIFVVFTLSGFLHVVFDVVCGKEDSKIGTMLFFQSFAFGIMVEDGVQAIWQRLTGEKFRSNSNPALWKKTVGHLWVVTFLVMVSPWFTYPITRISAEQMAFGPVKVAEKFGIRNSAIAIGVGAVPLWIAVKPGL